MQKLSMAFALCLGIAACGGDKINRGGQNESCNSHNDCAGGLVCLNGICSKSATPSVVVDGGVVTATPTVLSKAGESCSKRADCETGLGCYAGVCALSAPVATPVDAGVVTVTVTNTVYVTVDAGVNTALGARGETCSKTEDCAIGLVCLPLADSVGLGICDLANYGFTTSKKDCANECAVATDCCELPLGTAYNSCADLLKAMTPYTASNCSDQTAISKECFLYKTYCDCANNPTPAWACVSGQCSYTRACDPTVTGEKMNGCPAKTRSSAPVPACNATTRKCVAAAAVTGCTTADDCTTLGTSDTGETCAPNECVCLTDTARCYRKCNADLDCRAGYTCDITKQVCRPAGSCTVGSNAYCAQTLQNVSAKCVASTAGATTGTCRIPCTIDQDCSPSGILSTKFNGTVCGADKFCGGLGCNSDAECSLSITDGTTVLGSVKMFCAEHAAGTGPAVDYASAITD